MKNSADEPLSAKGPRIQLAKSDYVELWRYFETRGSELKGTMLQVSTLLIGFSAAILGYAVDKTLNFDAGPLLKQPGLLLLLSIVGIAVVLYAEVVIREFGEHINRNFDRADFTRIGDRSLDEILAYSERPGRPAATLPGICITVRWITRSFGAALVLGAALALAAIR